MPKQRKPYKRRIGSNRIPALKLLEPVYPIVFDPKQQKWVETDLEYWTKPRGPLEMPNSTSPIVNLANKWLELDQVLFLHETL